MTVHGKLCLWLNAHKAPGWLVMGLYDLGSKFMLWRVEQRIRRFEMSRDA